LGHAERRNDFADGARPLKEIANDPQPRFVGQTREESCVQAVGYAPPMVIRRYGVHVDNIISWLCDVL